MPTNSVYENLFHGINEIPLFTYGMLSITTVVLAYFTLYDIESATGEEGAEFSAATTDTDKPESKEEEKEKEEEQPVEQEDEQLAEEEQQEEEEKEEQPKSESDKQTELTEEGTPGKPTPETDSKPQTDVLETITGSPVSELSNLTENISKSLSPNEAPVTTTSTSPVVAETSPNVPAKPQVKGGHKKRKTKRSNKSTENKKTRNNRKKLQKK